MSEWKVITGDCLEVLRTIPAGSVDAVVTDPPYGMSYQSAWRTDKTSWFPKIAGDESPFVWFLPGTFASLREGGALACFCRWDSAEAFRLAIGWAGFHVGGQIVWDRLVHGMGDLNGSPAPMHDTIWFAERGDFAWPGSRIKSVLRHQRLQGDDLNHPNEKPVALMAELVAALVPPGATVLDPFCGSGTTGVACVQTGRNFIGIEIDPHYADIARRRIAEAANTLWTPKPTEQQGEMFAKENAP